MLTDRNLALAGAGVLIIGLFCPVLTMPVVGNLDFFTGAKVSAPTLLTLALIAGIVALSGRARDTFWPGIAAAAMLLYHFATLQIRLPQMRASVAESAGTPLGGVAGASDFHVQWGWLVLAAGTGLMVYVGVRSRRRAGILTFGAQDGPGKMVLSATVLLALGAISWSVFPR